IVEDCPACGKSLVGAVKISKPKEKKDVPQFQAADSIHTLTFGIKTLDQFFSGLRIGDGLFIVGNQENLMIARLCVRSLLARRRGGINSPVLLVDAGINSDVYQCVTFARQCGIDVKSVLDMIIVSRVFSIYQLTNLVACELEDARKKFGA